MIDRGSPAWRWGRIVVGGLVLGGIGVLVGNLLFPEPEVPALLRGLPNNYSQASPALTARLGARFPKGSDEALLIRELAAQGFKVSPPAHGADWRREGLPCTEIARIWWRAEAGRIVAVEGLRNAICP
jgi:hypothetical protein